MVRAKPIVVIFAAALAALLIASCFARAGQAATPLDTPGAAEKAPVERGGGRAYLFRGLIGLIDWGMDELAQRITRGGVSANINSHLVWRSVADQAISDYRRSPQPITVIGHSIGGDAAVDFAKTLDAAHIPVSLLITYDPTRLADKVPANVERYLNLYQSSNMLGGGDLVQGRGFHGHYASFNLKDRPEVVHVNLDKFDRIQEQLAGKIRSLAATPARGEGEAVPLRIVIPANVSIDLWDSGLPVSANAGDTLQTIAAAHHVPLWAVEQLNALPEHATLTEGQRIVVPRYLVPMAAPSAH
jgi:hypothetical protein